MSRREMNYNNNNNNYNTDDINDLDSERLKEIEDEVNNYLEEEGEDEYINPERNNNFRYEEPIFNNHLDNTPNHYQNKNIFASTIPNINNINPNPDVYTFLSTCKEKYNSIQGRLEDINKFKLEMEVKNKRIFELENTITGYKYEITRLLNKNEENLKMNQVWESTFKEIKGKIIKLEDEKSNLRDEIDKWKNKYDDLKFKNDLLIEKSKMSEENLNTLKKMQIDYEKSISEIKREYKNKEDNYKKKYKELEEGVMSKLREQDNDFLNEKENLIEKIRILEKENSKHLDTISEVNDKLQEISIDYKNREREMTLLLEEKDNKIKQIENNFQKLSAEANSHIAKLNDNITEINDKIKDKEKTYLTEIENLERNLKAEIEKNIEYEGFINTLSESREKKSSNENTEKSKNESNQLLISLQEENLKLQKEVTFLKKILSDKQEEVEKLQNDVNRTINSLNNSDHYSNNRTPMGMGMGINSQTMRVISKKEDEIQNLILKNSELERKNKKLLRDYTDLESNFDKSCYDYKCEINQKNEEIHLLKLSYEKLLAEFNSKLDRIIY